MVHTHTSLGAVNKKRGCQKKNEAFQMVFPHVIVFFSSSYRFPKRWLHTLIKEFILCFLCGMSAYNHQIYMISHVLFLLKISYLQSWNDAMALNQQRNGSRGMAHVRNTQTRYKSAKVGSVSVSHGPFLMPKVSKQVIYCCRYCFVTIWLFNIAMEAMTHRNRWFTYK